MAPVDLVDLTHGELVATVLAVEIKLRREWWLNHGHDYSAMYGDDGEMQCAACPADFKREPLDELQARVFAQRILHGKEPTV